MLKYMLDTTIVIYTMKNKPQIVRECFMAHHGEGFPVCVLKIGPIRNKCDHN